MNPNYIKKCTTIVGGQNKHENVIAIWEEPIKRFNLKLNQMK
jgi:hypothetical protein